MCVVMNAPDYPDYAELDLPRLRGRRKCMALGASDCVKSGFLRLREAADG